MNNLSTIELNKNLINAIRKHLQDYSIYDLVRIIDSRYIIPTSDKREDLIDLIISDFKGTYKDIY